MPFIFVFHLAFFKALKESVSIGPYLFVHAGIRPGVAVACGLYWGKLTPGGGNPNRTTSSALTDMGGGATFFDNLVEVRPAPEPDPR